MALSNVVIWIILSVVLILGITGNCENNVEGPSGWVNVFKEDYTSDDIILSELTSIRIKLEPMKISKEDAPYRKWIDVGTSENGYGVVEIPEILKNEMAKKIRHEIAEDVNDEVAEEVNDDLSKEADICLHQKLGHVLQTPIIDQARQDHPDLIVIPIALFKRDYSLEFIDFAHIDFTCNVKLQDLLKDPRTSSDLMYYFAKHDSIRKTALRVYNGDIEKLAIEMLTIVNMMNIWVPLAAVESWPLAFMELTHPDPLEKRRRFHTCKPTLPQAVPIQVLKASPLNADRWSTRYNMQFGEMYIWNSATVAHSAVNIKTTAWRNSFDFRMLFVKSIVDLDRLYSSRNHAKSLCYSESFYMQLRSQLGNEEATKKKLNDEGYTRVCDRTNDLDIISLDLTD